MARPDSPKLAPLETLLGSKHGKPIPLPRNLQRLYGDLRMPAARTRPYVYSNFVTTLDGVVSYNIKGHASGGDISGFSAQDRMVMGLLRAMADVVIIGAGTLGADTHALWTAENIFPDLAHEYQSLRRALGKPSTPLNVVVSGSGSVDLRLPVFASGLVTSVILTTSAGAKRLGAQRRKRVEIRAIRRGAGAIAARTILDAVIESGRGRMVLLEGGPQLVGDFYAERLLDEQFLTLSPQIAGRIAGDARLNLVMGTAFAPRSAPWGNLIDARRGGNLLFLRYAFARSTRR